MKNIFKNIVVVLIFVGCSNSDYIKDAPLGYVFIFEGGNQNRVIKNNKTIIDSGVVNFKFNKDYIVFSVDTTFSNKQNKEVLLYYIHDIKKDHLYRNMNMKEFKKIIKKNSLDDLDITN